MTKRKARAIATWTPCSEGLAAPSTRPPPPSPAFSADVDLPPLSCQSPSDDVHPERNRHLAFLLGIPIFSSRHCRHDAITVEMPFLYKVLHRRYITRFPSGRATGTSHPAQAGKSSGSSLPVAVYNTVSRVEKLGSLPALPHCAVYHRAILQIRLDRGGGHMGLASILWPMDSRAMHYQ